MSITEGPPRTINDRHWNLEDVTDFITREVNRINYTSLKMLTGLS